MHGLQTLKTRGIQDVCRAAYLHTNLLIEPNVYMYLENKTVFDKRIKSCEREYTRTPNLKALEAHLKQ